MSNTTTPPNMNPAREEFASMLEESLGTNTALEGSVVKGRITAIENDFAIVDVGLKMEGRIALEEFSPSNKGDGLSIGDEVEVYLEQIENSAGEAVLSREKARHEEGWEELEALFAAEEKVEGIIFGRVKGGFTVDLKGATAFLPGSQVDVRPVRDITPLMNRPQNFQILKMDRRRGNIVVSRRAIMEETRAEQRNELVQNLQEGNIEEGIVKNITDYGAFIDLGGVDGLLHVTDIAWRRINHPSEVLAIGDKIKVQIIKINQETQRISLGIKQLEDDPWQDIENHYAISSKHKGKITNITDYGAFVELSSGIEGLVHVSEMSWVKKNVPPGKIVSTSQEVEVMVLEVDAPKRRISLGLKQCQENPWQQFAEQTKNGDQFKGEIKNITEFGLFIGLNEDIDGMVHMSDLSWTEPGEKALAKYKKGESVEAVVLEVDIEKERISLGIKQLAGDPLDMLSQDIKKGDVVTCTVTAVTEGGLEVAIGKDAITCFIRRGDLSRERSEQRPERFAVGDKVDAMLTSFDKTGRKISLSIKALEIAEEKEAVAQYGSSDSGASLGDILGAALNPKDEEAKPKEEKKEAKPKTEKKEAKPKAEKKEAKPKAEKEAKPKKAEAKED